MTNQANQAFEDFYNENKHLYTDTSPYGIMLTTFQAASQASEKRITELQAHVNQLREALESAIESDEQMKDEARPFLTGLELGVKTFESMSEHLRLSGAYLPDWFLNSKGHINKMAKAHYIYESMLKASPTMSLTSETNTEVGE